MKSLLSIIIIFFSIVFAYAEYQAYNFSMTIKRPAIVLSTISGKVQTSYTLKSETVKGYLVTVCCYPCGASFGKGYPSWLFVKRSDDPTDSLWKVQCNAFGGLFGDKISPSYMEDKDFNQVSVIDKPSFMKYVKETSRSWVRLEFDGDEEMATDTYVMKQNKTSMFVKEMFCGTNTDEFYLCCSGFGEAGWKWNYKVADKYAQFNMYIKNASGQVVGWTKTENGFSYDPCNYIIDYKMPVCGTFNISFNKKLTEELRGTADWNVISMRVYSKMKFKQVIDEEFDSELMSDYSFYEY